MNTTASEIKGREKGNKTKKKRVTGEQELVRKGTLYLSLESQSIDT